MPERRARDLLKFLLLDCLLPCWPATNGTAAPCACRLLSQTGCHCQARRCLPHLTEASCAPCAPTPPRQVFVPPKVFVEMAVTLIGGLAALATTLWSGAKEGRGLAAAWTGLSLLGARAMQVGGPRACLPACRCLEAVPPAHGCGWREPQQPCRLQALPLLLLWPAGLDAGL